MVIEFSCIFTTHDDCLSITVLCELYGIETLCCVNALYIYRYITMSICFCFACRLCSYYDKLVYEYLSLAMCLFDLLLHLLDTSADVTQGSPSALEDDLDGLH